MKKQSLIFSLSLMACLFARAVQIASDDWIPPSEEYLSSGKPTSVESCEGFCALALGAEDRYVWNTSNKYFEDKERAWFDDVMTNSLIRLSPKDIRSGAVIAFERSFADYSISDRFETNHCTMVGMTLRPINRVDLTCENLKVTEESLYPVTRCDGGELFTGIRANTNTSSIGIAAREIQEIIGVDSSKLIETNGNFAIDISALFFSNEEKESFKRARESGFERMDEKWQTPMSSLIASEENMAYLYRGHGKFKGETHEYSASATYNWKFWVLNTNDLTGTVFVHYEPDGGEITENVTTSKFETGSVGIFKMNSFHRSYGNGPSFVLPYKVVGDPYESKVATAGKYAFSKCSAKYVNGVPVTSGPPATAVCSCKNTRVDSLIMNALPEIKPKGVIAEYEMKFDDSMYYSIKHIATDDVNEEDTEKWDLKSRVFRKIDEGEYSYDLSGQVLKSESKALEKLMEYNSKTWRGGEYPATIGGVGSGTVEMPREFSLGDSGIYAVYLIETRELLGFTDSISEYPDIREAGHVGLGHSFSFTVEYEDDEQNEVSFDGAHIGNAKIHSPNLYMDESTDALATDGMGPVPYIDESSVDVVVDVNAADGGDGTSERPFNNIDNAIAAVAPVQIPPVQSGDAPRRLLGASETRVPKIGLRAGRYGIPEFFNNYSAYYPPYGSQYDVELVGLTNIAYLVYTNNTGFYCSGHYPDDIGIIDSNYTTPMRTKFRNLNIDAVHNKYASHLSLHPFSFITFERCRLSGDLYVRHDAFDTCRFYDCIFDKMTVDTFNASHAQGWADWPNLLFVCDVSNCNFRVSTRETGSGANLACFSCESHIEDSLLYGGNWQALTTFCDRFGEDLQRDASEGRGLYNSTVVADFLVFTNKIEDTTSGETIFTPCGSNTLFFANGMIEREPQTVACAMFWQTNAVNVLDYRSMKPDYFHRHLRKMGFHRDID